MTMNEACAAKFKEMSEEFKKNSEKLLQDISDGFAGSYEGAAKNYTDMQDSYLKGVGSLTTEAKKANGEMLANMAKNYEEIKTNVKTFYQQIQKEVNDAFNMTYTQFTTQCDEVVKKFPKLQASAYKDAITQLKASQAKHLTQFTKRYDETLKELEQKYTKLVKDVKLAELPPPKITKLTITTK